MQRFCKKCGKPIRQGETFCGYCGTSILKEFTPKKKRPSGKSRDTVIISVCASLLVLLLAVLAILVYNHVKDAVEDETHTVKPDIPIPTPTETIPYTPNPTDTPKPSPSPDRDITALVPEDIITLSGITYTGENPVTMPGYDYYVDNKFPLEIDLPSHFIERQQGSSICRKNLVSASGDAAMRVCAAYNGGAITAEELKNRFANLYGGEITYSAGKEEWFAMSCNDSLRYHYAYYSVRDGMIRGFEFHFSGAENNDIYAGYIEHIYSSLKNG